MPGYLQDISQMAQPKSTDTVERFDFTRIDSARVTETPQGFLRISGNLTRVGVLNYTRADGSVFRELRTPDEVFREDSLGTMRLAPVTDLHRAMITPSNVGDFQIGMVTEDVAHNDRFMTGSSLIQRADAIANVRSKKRCELSPGYRCWVQAEAGEWNGQKYDGIQRDIVYNHLAIGPKNWGRSGPDVALRMDGLAAAAACSHLDATELGSYLRERLSDMTYREIADRLDMGVIEVGAMLDGFVVPDDARLDAIAALADVDVDTLRGFVSASGTAASAKRDGVPPTPKTNPRGFVTMKTVQIKIDGVAFDIEVPEALASAFADRFATLQAKADKLDGVEGALVAAKKLAVDTQEKLDAATDPAAVNVAIAARAEVVANAKLVAPDLAIDVKLDDNGVKIAALVASGYPAATFEKRDAGFVDGVFVGALAAAAKVKTDGGDGDVDGHPVVGTRSGGPAPRTDSGDAPTDKFDSDAAYARMVERNRGLAAGKLDKSSTRFSEGTA